MKQKSRRISTAKVLRKKTEQNAPTHTSFLDNDTLNPQNKKPKAG